MVGDEAAAVVEGRSGRESAGGVPVTPGEVVHLLLGFRFRECDPIKRNATFQSQTLKEFSRRHSVSLCMEADPAFH
jgi:hypothetical protein